MKRMRIISWLWIPCLALVAGCSGTAELIKQRGVSSNMEVYTDVSENTQIPAGSADLRIVFSMKTHVKNFHILENRTRGTGDYVLVMNIDGQAEGIQGESKEENTMFQHHRTPESGNGIRYRFNKNIRLKAGVHRIFLAVPADKVAVEKEIRLDDGSANELVIEPLYGNWKRTGKRIPNFHSHLMGIGLSLNGKPL